MRIAPLGGRRAGCVHATARAARGECRAAAVADGRAKRPGGVRWAETSARNVSAHFAPVDVASQLSALMEAQPCAWILTSATLAVGDDFSHFKRRSGLARATHRALREPVRLRQPGADVPAEGSRRTGRAGARAQRHQRARCRCSRRAAAAPSCCSRATAACAKAPRSCYRHWGETPPFPVLIQGDALARPAAARVSRGRQRGAARHRQLLGRRRRQGRRRSAS